MCVRLTLFGDQKQIQPDDDGNGEYDPPLIVCHLRSAASSTCTSWSSQPLIRRRKPQLPQWELGLSYELCPLRLCLFDGDLLEACGLNARPCVGEHHPQVIGALLHLLADEFVAGTSHVLDADGLELLHSLCIGCL